MLTFFFLFVLFPTSPPATDGSNSQASEHQIMKKKQKKQKTKPIVLSHYIQKVCYVLGKKLNCRYCTTEVWNVKMSLKTK